MGTIAWWVGLVLVFAPLSAQAQETSDALRASIRARLDSAALDGFSGTVLVERRGEVVLHAAYGDADPNRGTPASTSTVYDIGSITKQFTKAAILALRDQGSLRLDDPLTRFFDEVPADKREITLDQILAMTAGFAEYVDQPGEAGDFADVSRIDALTRILGTPLRFAPGSDRAYSNAGYTMLALIIERVSGQEYETFVRERLLRPAGLERTGFYGDRDRWSERDVAVGYNNGHYGENSPYHWPRIQWAMAGNGGMVSNPEELHRWIGALRSGRVLSDSSVRDMYSGFLPTEAAPPNRPVIAYAGANDFGFESVVFELFDGEGVVIVATNGGRVMALARDLAERVAGKPIDMGSFGPGAGSAQTTIEGDGAGDGPWGLPDSPRGRRIAAFLDMIDAGTEDAARRFVRDEMTAGFRDAFPLDQHLAVLTQTQRILQDPEVLSVQMVDPTVTVRIRGGRSGDVVVVSLELDAADAYAIALISIEG